MLAFETHLCLVSDQAMANLLPALDREMKPKSVVLAVSDEMVQKARWLEQILKQHGCKVEILPIGAAYDLYSVGEALLNWLAQHQGENIALNITGGTKVMAIAAQAVSQSADLPIFYANVSNDELFMLGERSEPRKLAANINLKDFLAAHGYKIIRSEKPHPSKPWEDLTERLIDQVDKFGPALGRVNQLAADAFVKNGQPKPQTLNDGDRNNSLLNELLDYFELAKVLQVQEARVVFKDETARAFANGGWLELHVYMVLSQLAGHSDIAHHVSNIRFTSADGKSDNEIDAGFLSKNRLHIIECKTANLGRATGNRDSKATDALYKLETLLKIGGLRTRAALIDYRGGLSKADKARAAQSKIKIFSKDQLKHLGGHIKEWVYASH